MCVPAGRLGRLSHGSVLLQLGTEECIEASQEDSVFGGRKNRGQIKCLVTQKSHLFSEVGHLEYCGH